jgi:hypothetical protein
MNAVQEWEGLPPVKEKVEKIYAAGVANLY